MNIIYQIKLKNGIFISEKCNVSFNYKIYHCEVQNIKVQIFQFVLSYNKENKKVKYIMTTSENDRGSAIFQRNMSDKSTNRHLHKWHGYIAKKVYI